LTLNGLHGVISQKIVLFTTTAVSTSNPTREKLVKSAYSNIIKAYYKNNGFVTVYVINVWRKIGRVFVKI
jgi:hypothetical protein